MTAQALARCTLCGLVEVVTIDGTPGVASAAHWAVHFANRHPWLGVHANVSLYIELGELPEETP